MNCKQLQVPLLAVITLAVGLSMATGADAGRENTAAVSIRASEKTAVLRITGLSDVSIDCAESADPDNTGHPSAVGDYPPFEWLHVDLVTPGSSPSDYTITRIWTVTDSRGNQRASTQKIKVSDTTPPEITCPPDVTFECDNVGDFGVATATDDSGQDPIITYRDSIVSQLCDYEYVMIRTWTATDESDNSASCEQIITINDSTPPVIICPPDTTVACNEVGDLPHAEVYDNCVEDPPVNYEPILVDNYPRFRHVVIRSWEVTDGCCNVVGCNQKVTLLDTIPPVLECAPDDTIACQTDPIFTDPVATDQCHYIPTIEVVSTDTTVDGATGSEIFTRCWVAYDDFANQSEECCQTIVRLPCEDGTCTFTQGGWGNRCPVPQQGDPNSTQPGCIRDYYFGSVFPSGVTIGIPAGSTHGATWTTASAVEGFLPANGTPGPLTGDLTDPTTTPAGVLAGQILALRMNREYSCAGVFNIALNPDAVCLGTLGIPEGCGGSFEGMTVDAFLALADSAVAGVAEVLAPYGADFSDVNETATCINEYYNGCGEGDDPGTVLADPVPALLAGAPDRFAVLSVTPNPLGNSTTIRYAVPFEGRVRIEIFDIHGRQVAGLLDHVKPAGYHAIMWKGDDSRGKTAAQGVYFCRVEFEDRPAIMHKLIKVE